MKIVFLGTRGFPNVQGGVEKHCENLAANLVKLGCRVTVFTRRPYVNKEVREYKGVVLIDLPAVRQKCLEALLHTFLGIIMCLKHKPDLIHIHGIGPGLFIPLAKFLGFRVVLTTHGSNYMHNKWNTFEKAFLRVCEFISIRFADRIIAVSEIIVNEIKQRYRREAIFIPNGIEVPQFEKSREMLDKLNLEPGKYILAVGRIVPEKGFHDLVDAFWSAALEGWKLVIVGGIDHQSRYSSDLLKRAENDNRIIFAGFLSGRPLFQLYENAGLYVLPSYYEGMPISLLEAMSFGLTCIASDIPANRSMGLPEESYFKAGNCQELAEKLVSVISSSMDLRTDKDRICRLLDEYDWGVITRKTIAAYCGK